MEQIEIGFLRTIGAMLAVFAVTALLFTITYLWFMFNGPQILPYLWLFLYNKKTLVGESRVFFYLCSMYIMLTSWCG